MAGSNSRWVYSLACSGYGLRWPTAQWNVWCEQLRAGLASCPAIAKDILNGCGCTEASCEPFYFPKISSEGLEIYFAVGFHLPSRQKLWGQYPRGRVQLNLLTAKSIRDILFFGLFYSSPLAAKAVQWCARLHLLHVCDGEGRRSVWYSCARALHKVC